MSRCAAASRRPPPGTLLGGARGPQKLLARGPAAALSRGRDQPTRAHLPRMSPTQSAGAQLHPRSRPFWGAGWPRCMQDSLAVHAGFAGCRIERAIAGGLASVARSRRRPVAVLYERLFIAQFNNPKQLAIYLNAPPLLFCTISGNLGNLRKCVIEGYQAKCCRQAIDFRITAVAHRR